MSQVYETFARYFKKQNCLFWRFEPSVLVQTKSLKFTKTLDINPQATLIKDLQLTEEQLLASFHPKVRYNIRLSQRKGLVISEKKDFAAFWRLMQETGERDEFSLHPQHTYRRVVESDFTHQITVYYGNLAVASGVFVGAGQRLFYVYGASDHAHRELMAPHLIQWEAIKLAKKLGLRYYDFFGIAPGTIDENSKEYVYDKNHPYARVTEFKLRFNGLPIVEPGTYDMVLSPLYYLYTGLRKLRRLF